MKTYRPIRGGHGVTVHEDGKQRVLDPRLDLKNYHSTGYAWGVEWPAAWQLSLALLCDALEDDERAVRLHKAYMLEHVSKLNRDAGFMLTADTIRLDARLIEDRAKRT